MIATTYRVVKPGEWVQPIRRGYKLACCDCGLVHRVDFRIYRGRIQFRAYRAEHLTATLRKRGRDPAPVDRLRGVADAINRRQPRPTPRQRRAWADVMWQACDALDQRPR